MTKNENEDIFKSILTEREYFFMNTEISVNLGNKKEPLPDLYYCPECDLEFNTSQCIQIEELDWENRHYTVHSCPDCGDNAGKYRMSEKRLKKWYKWRKKNLSSVI
ncbi:MAG: hypothetical protein CO117_13285 [Flavobacteriaceae bacterium CG_4_9_14_3_um_filter_33_16]|nr:MAG: hypothetical protein CO117_13285 [Flavobacteriaceae bacterium CG_4_9_14_3_um_filter_33_16]